MKVTWPEDPSQLPDVWRKLGNENQHRIMWNKVYLRYYFDLQDSTYLPVGREYDEWAAYRESKNAAYNLTRMVIDSVAPSVCAKLRAVFDPVCADYEADRTCKDAMEAISAVMDAVQYWDKASVIAYRDGSASDIGTVLWYVDGGGEIRCTNVS